jgi:protein SCO1/2
VSRIPLLLSAALGLVAFGCRAAPEGRRYPLTGQVLAVHAERDEVLVRHDDIPGFMPAMVMPFSVRDKRLLDRLQPGDLVKGVLVVGEATALLEALERTGSRPLPAEAAAAPEGALAPGSPVPDVRLLDSEGREQRLSSWRGRALALTFIFTRCPLPEFCPALDRRFAELASLVRADPALRGSVLLVSISFDPAFDTPDVLRDHARRLGADHETWVFATGEGAEVEALGAAFGLSVAREGGITHNLRTAVVDPSGRLVKVYRGADWDPHELLRDLRAAAQKGSR